MGRINGLDNDGISRGADEISGQYEACCSAGTDGARFVAGAGVDHRFDRGIHRQVPTSVYRAVLDCRSGDSRDFFAKASAQQPVD